MRTKLYLLLYSIELSKRLAGTEIIVNSINPGLFKSGIRRKSLWLLSKIVELLAIPADKAAEKVVFQVSSNEVPENSGKIFNRKKEKRLTLYWNDINVREHLWSVTESLIAKVTIPAKADNTVF